MPGAVSPGRKQNRPAVSLNQKIGCFDDTIAVVVSGHLKRWQLTLQIKEVSKVPLSWAQSSNTMIVFEIGQKNNQSGPTPWHSDHQY